MVFIRSNSKFTTYTMGLTRGSGIMWHEIGDETETTYGRFLGIRLLGEKDRD